MSIPKIKIPKIQENKNAGFYGDNGSSKVIPSPKIRKKRRREGWRKEDEGEGEGAYVRWKYGNSVSCPRVAEKAKVEGLKGK